jgi:hypothetical protein
MPGGEELSVYWVSVIVRVTGRAAPRKRWVTTYFVFDGITPASSAAAVATWPSSWQVLL